MSNYSHTLETCIDKPLSKKEFLNILEHILPDNIIIREFSVAHKEEYCNDYFYIKNIVHSFDIKCNVNSLEMRR